ncbi:hypothetical protein PRN20_22285 [Devosia sp. ZB163]|uniref:porin n=1 Tax=Devosia sp. ZB163 TaxID=3025938 RepID=UPI00236202C2|nr:porin [Devosia sp. ZB163]MDC9826475.1 hypothetical protein [Devosia sp. ZB163]
MRIRRKHWALLVLAGLPAPVAMAADQSATTATEQEAGVVEAEAPPEHLIPDLKIGDDKNWAEFYGQIDKGILFYDDGVEELTFFPVDNSNSSTRFGIRALGTISDDLTLGGNWEVEWNPYATGNVNQLNIDDFDWDTSLLRKAELYFTSETYGKFWFGQGSMASDGTAEVDYSGTTVIGYANVNDMAGGLLFRFDDGTLSDVAIDDAFSDFDGAGRKARVRYDTPSWEGFSLSGSVGTQIVPTITDIPVWDVAARYEKELGDFKVGGAAAVSVPGEDVVLLDGSISVLHTPSGISITLAGAVEENDASDADARYVYGKVGYQTEYFDWGMTAVSVDAYIGEDVAAAGSESRSIGAQFVQNIDYLQTELYLGARLYEYDEDVASFDDGFAVLSGARLRF